jgi:hypothetical protein
MAASINSEKRVVSSSEGILGNKNELVCECCVEMKVELLNVKSELNSYKEIV